MVFFNVFNFCLLLVMVYGECDPGWEHRWNKCYYFSTEIRNWEDAETVCRQYGSHLVEVESADEDEYIRAYSRNTGRSNWIGLRDSVTEGDWRWSQGGARPEYTNWATNEPDNIFDQDCALLDLLYNYHWVSGVCWLGHNFICEKDYPSTEVPAVG
ncbi:perlucin-like protein [Mytilus galloprovincialis]|uniref:perlucin-like protein n=1 Tax=Mytilus galloprovincialis TaxID=29158 RepID=UPI003F7C2801